jgi:hypothetical protein
MQVLFLVLSAFPGRMSDRREVIIPLYNALRSVLASIPKRATTILTNSRCQPWKVNGLGTAFNRAKIGAGVGARDLHFHDLRRTAATRFYIAPRRSSTSSIGPKREAACKTDCKTGALKMAKYWSGRRESNPRIQLGKLSFCH